VKGLADRVRLSKTRRKRPVPEDWATPEVIEQFDLQELSVPDPSVQRVDEVQPLAIDSSGNLVITSGTTGDTTIFEISSGEHKKPRESDPVRTTAAVFWNGHPILGQANGAVKVFNTNGDIAGVMHLHAGPVTGLTLHPCGDLLASVSEDKSYIFYDLNTLKPVQRVATDSGMYDNFYALTQPHSDLF
jgi:pre-mRNA-processing factor 19